jgi:hypothetical protein
MENQNVKGNFYSVRARCEFSSWIELKPLQIEAKIEDTSHQKAS